MSGGECFLCIVHGIYGSKRRQLVQAQVCRPVKRYIGEHLEKPKVDANRQSKMDIPHMGKTGCRESIHSRLEVLAW